MSLIKQLFGNRFRQFLADFRTIRSEEPVNSHTYHYTDMVAPRVQASPLGELDAQCGGLTVSEKDNIPCGEEPFSFGPIETKEEADFLYEMGVLTQEERLDAYAGIDADTIKVAYELKKEIRSGLEV